MAAGISRPDSSARPSRPGLRDVVLRVVATRSRMADPARRRAEADPGCPMDAGCLRLAQPAHEPDVRVAWSSFGDHVAGLEPETRPIVVESALPVNPGNSGGFGFGLAAWTARADSARSSVGTREPV